MASHNRRPSFTDPPADPTPPSGVDPETAPSSTSTTHFAMAPNPRHISRHTRAQSYTPRRPNRLSLSFPVAPPDSVKPTPTSSNPSPFPATPVDMLPPPSPNDPSGFLVALAGQERKVLELREELHKAEADLETLQIKWESHQKMRKRAETRQVEQLQPLQAVAISSGRSSEEADSTSRQSAELDRRKALLSNLTREPSRRKVIRGGHTRALSLLSPDRSNYTQPFPPVQESSAEFNGPNRSNGIPDTSQGITRITTNRARHSYQGGVTSNAKQIAGDVRAGLWTFLEDLRQATVGDEAIASRPNRPSLEPSRTNSRRSPASNERAPRTQSPKDQTQRTWDSLTGSNAVLLDAGGTYYVDPSRRASKAGTLTAKEISRKPPSPLNIADLDDAWSNWDSPNPKSPRWSGGSTEPSEPATPCNTHAASRSQAVKILDQSTDILAPPARDEIQWPALEDLTPGNLGRTVSNIMKEWEKSLTPPEEGRDPLGSRTEKRPQPRLG